LWYPELRVLYLEADILLKINDLQCLCNDKSTAITKHAKNRLLERGISVADVQNAIQTGEIIKQYEDDKPFASCLLLGLTEKNDNIHVVASIDNEYLYIITAYYPDIDEWESDLKTKKEQ
jgi:DNA-directed RNA polymerase beta' subunit